MIFCEISSLNHIFFFHPQDSSNTLNRFVFFFKLKVFIIFLDIKPSIAYPYRPIGMAVEPDPWELNQTHPDFDR